MIKLIIKLKLIKLDKYLKENKVFIKKKIIQTKFLRKI
jgi:hypothetical protein